ncbi:MAG TPA: acetyl-CoA carboxylase carboxyltransferase subunit alpha [Vicinamibacterales bacterium]|nr:acetyl-CoA carboxylase carboxyltransferase subunit alpha [Vicinamibacterales bacterium]
MLGDLLDFEEPVAVLLKEIEALKLMPKTTDRLASIARLEARVRELRTEIFAGLGAWERLQVARHPNRPGTLDYIERLFPDFSELHGDRRFADDKAMIAGLGYYHDKPVAVVGHQKGRETKQKIYRNFGYAKPEGYRKALRVMKMAEKFRLPVLVFVDTPAAYPGVESEERGVAEAIAVNLREMALLDTPIVILVCGEGGSGGALGIAVGDRVLMQEFSVYSVIPPEGCAAILWRDAKRKVDAAKALKITAPDLLSLELIDEIVKEPVGGAHLDYDEAASLVDEALLRHLGELQPLEAAARLDARYQKFRAMGRLGQAFFDDSQPAAPGAAPRLAAASGGAGAPAIKIGSGRSRSGSGQAG